MCNFFLENDSFELDDFFEPPKPISQSSPELNTMIPEGPVMRAAVSSTELLYERAMARFYKAVEYEQTEMARKRSVSVDYEAKRLSVQADPQEAALTRLRINSMSENEKKSVLRRRLSGESPNLNINIPKRLSFTRDEELEEFNKTYLNTIRNEINTPEMLSASDRSLSPYASPSEEKFSDDYSASTITSDEDDEALPRRSRSREKDAAAQHARMLSPYRQPQKDEAAEVLTKNKSPLPNPNFVPKPILKRPASADGRKSNPLSPAAIESRRSLSPLPLSNANKNHRKSVEIDDVPIIIGADDDNEEINKTIEIKIEASPIKDVPEIKVEEAKGGGEDVEEEEFDPEIIRRAEQTKRKLIERRQSSIEENKVVADFYDDIVKSHSVAKPKVPIYMNPEALKALEVEEEENQIDSGVMSSAELSPQSTMSRPFSPNVEQQQQKRSKSPFSRRASDITKNRTFSPPPSTSSERRASDTQKLHHKLSENFSNLPLKDSLKTFSPNYNRLELNKSPSPQNIPQTAAPVEVEEKKSEIIEETQRGRNQSVTGTVPKQKRKVSKSRSRDSSIARTTTITTSSRPISMPSNDVTITRREKSSSRTRNRSESKSPSAMNRKIIFNRFAPPPTQQQQQNMKLFKKDDVITPSSQSPISSRAVTPSELQEIVDVKVKTTMTHATDVSILIFATYIYFFKSALLALPILLLLIYRQIADKIPNFMKRNRKPPN